MVDRRRLALNALRVRGQLTVNELADELQITRTAATNQLARLIADGMVGATGLRSTGRRPSVVYSLTSEADRAFHEAYDALANDVLTEIGRGGREKVQRVLRGVGDRWIAGDVPSVEKLSGEARLDRAKKLIAVRGFMPTLERAADRRRVLRNHNCPILRVCRAHHEAADMVKRWVEALVGRKIRRSACIFQGGHACEYALGVPARATRR
jgi:predicted ArsR family transcriptional regulator